MSSLADRITGRIEAAALAVLLVLTAVLAVGAAFRDSVTVDEFAVMPGGLALLEAGAFQMDAGVPPLPKILVALPARLAGAKLAPILLKTYKSAWDAGEQFQTENPERYHALYLRSRLASIAVLLLTCLLTWGYARSLYGPVAGLLAASFACFWPDLLAHGHLATTDIYLAAAVIGSMWAFDRFLRRPGVASASVLGATLGLGCLCKLTGVLVPPLLVAILVAIRLGIRAGWTEDAGFVRLDFRSLRLGAAGLVACLLVIAAGYGFVWFGWFFRGFTVQMGETGYEAYLMGKLNYSGFWNYYLVGFLVKTPVAAIVMVVLATLVRPRPLARELPLLLISIAFFGFFSLAGHKNIGVRYLLFLVPIACVWIGRAAGRAHPVLEGRGTARALVCAAGAAGMLVTALLAWPHYLSYFNAPSGGPSRGHYWLLDSNLDWGQGLIELRDYMKRERIDSVALASFGRVKPEIYGIGYTNLAPEQRVGRYAVISANLLWGRMYFVNGTPYWPEDPNVYAPFRTMEPVAVLADILYVYDLAPLMRPRR